MLKDYLSYTFMTLEVIKNSYKFFQDFFVNLKNAPVSWKNKKNSFFSTLIVTLQRKTTLLKRCGLRTLSDLCCNSLV